MSPRKDQTQKNFFLPFNVRFHMGESTPCVAVSSLFIATLYDNIKSYIEQERQNRGKMLRYCSYSNQTGTSVNSRFDYIHYDEVSWIWNHNLVPCSLSPSEQMNKSISWMGPPNPVDSIAKLFICHPILSYLFRKRTGQLPDFSQSTQYAQLRTGKRDQITNACPPYHSFSLSPQDSSE